MALASSVCHLGLLHMRPLQLWLKSQVPWREWTVGCMRIKVTNSCVRSLRILHDPEMFSRGVPLGLVTARTVVTTATSTSGWGTVCEGIPASRLWSQSKWHINLLELKAMSLALMAFLPQVDQ